MEWIDIPAHRVLKINYQEMLLDFHCLTEEGQIAHNGAAIHRVIRLTDNKVFRIPRYHRVDEDMGQFFFLEEI